MRAPLGVSRERAQEYLERVLARPRSDYELVLRRTRGGTALLLNRKALTKCYASKVGLLQATFMARALGADLPAEGESVTVHAPAGVLYRAVSISTLDLRKPEAWQVLRELLAVAEMQRTGSVSSSEE